MQDFPDEDIELILNDAYGFKSCDLSFVEHVPRLKRLLVTTDDPITGLRLPSSIERVGLGAAGSPIDFAGLPNLVDASIDWSKNTESICLADGLKSLNCWGLKAVDIRSFSGLTLLEHLGLYSSATSCLDGIEAFAALKSLELAADKRLFDVQAVSRLSRLESFAMEGCSKVDDLSGLGDCSALKRLTLERCKGIKSYQFLSKLKELVELIIVESGDMESLEPVAQLPKLHSLNIFGTNVLDGDIGQLLRCKQLYNLNFEKKKHYSHGSDELLGLLKTS